MTDEDDDIDFELDLAVGEESPVAEETATLDMTDEDDDIDFELDLAVGEESPVAEETATLDMTTRMTISTSSWAISRTRPPR